MKPCSLSRRLTSANSNHGIRRFYIGRRRLSRYPLFCRSWPFRLVERRLQLRERGLCRLVLSAALDERVFSQQRRVEQGIEIVDGAHHLRCAPLVVGAEDDEWHVALAIV